jgi:hypothetical protein
MKLVGKLRLLKIQIHPDVLIHSGNPSTRKIMNSRPAWGYIEISWVEKRNSFEH